MIHEQKSPDKDLIKSISEIISHKGLKGTTMDSVASQLGMSKRTLYEIFESKNEMILCVVKYWHSLFKEWTERIFSTAENVMEAMYLTFNEHIRFMRDVNVEVFRDMDNEFTQIRTQFEAQRNNWIEKILKVIEKGENQGVFRKDINYPVLLTMMHVQLESLKRMEEFFPQDINIVDAFETVTTGFLRSIATIDGMKVLDRTIERFAKNNIN